jgi:hypothetical protein
MNWEIDSTSGFVKVSKIEVDVGPAGLRTYEKGTVDLYTCMYIYIYIYT